MAKCCLF